MTADDCDLELVRRRFANGEWRATELSAQECLRQQPLTTEVRLILVRLYLMRAYAAREPRWLDEARRQLHMAESDPAFAEESKMLLRLVDEPTVE